MRISPAYDTDPLIRLEGAPGAVAEPFLRQRRRLAASLASLAPDQWSAPSRCEGWRLQDVVAHLADTDRFWSVSIAGGLAGEPTRLLTRFDPKATPAALVDAVRGASPDETLASFLAADTALCDTVESLDDDGWNAVAETPVGHVAIDALVHHAIWDAWIHERDMLLPLGITPDREDDEVLASLRYVAALSPAFALQTTTGRTGALALSVERPAASIVLTVDDVVGVGDGAVPDDALVLTGDAVDVLEALSLRVPWQQSIPPEQAWLVAGLGEVFESVPAG